VVVSAGTIFVDRDGTLIEEPYDNQVDSLAKVRFMPGVFAALSELAQRGYRLVMVTNQNGLGAPSFPFAAFTEAHEFVLNAFATQGIRFDDVFVCPHRESDGCNCRKPRTGLVDAYLRDRPIDLVAMIGDRDTDLEFARNLNTRGLRVRLKGTPGETWPSVVRALTARRAEVLRETKETRVEVRVDLDEETLPQVSTGVGFFNHMLEQLATHGGFSMELSCRGDLEIDEHHTVEDCALALGDALRRALGTKAGISRYGFLLPMDEAKAQVAIDLSGRPFSTFSGHFARDTVGSFPTELVPHFFRSLSEGLKAAIHVSVQGENTHHMVEACFKGVGRSLRQAFKCEGHELPSTKGAL
jgi:imidazoleglycerol-phosphate dehydratase / histidinol-phosphatase